LKKQTSLFSNTAILGAAAFLSKATVFLLMPFYTAKLAPADFGTADILVSTALLLLPFVSLNMPEAVFRFLAGREREKNEVFSVCVFLLFLGMTLFLLMLLFVGDVSFLGRYRYYLLCYVMASIMRSFLSHMARAEGRYVLYAVQQLCCSLITVLLQILFLSMTTWGAGGYLLGVIIGDFSVALGLFFLLRSWRLFSVSAIKWERVRELLAYALPLVPTAVLWWITSISDRYFLLHYQGAFEMGLYAAASKLPTALTFLVSIFLEAWQYAAIGTGEKHRAARYGSVYAMLLPVAITLAAGMLSLAYPVVCVIYAPEYRGAVAFVPVLTLSALFSALSSFLGSIYVVKLKSGASLFGALLGALLNFVLNFLLIPRLGGMGAALATLFSYVAVFGFRVFHTGRYLCFSRHLLQLSLSLGYLSLAAFAVSSGEYAIAVLPAVLSPLPFLTEIEDLFLLLLEKVRGFLKKRQKAANRY